MMKKGMGSKAVERSARMRSIMSLTRLSSMVVTLGGKKIYCTHGHAEHVKYGTDELICRARQEGADIVLYGHTHSGVTAYDDGLYIMNPGSIRDGHYGMIDIVPGGIMLNEAKL